MNDEVEKKEEMTAEARDGAFGAEIDSDPGTEEDYIPEAAISEDEARVDEQAQTIEDALAGLEQERDELKDQVLRVRAEFDNFRKRMARDNELTRKTATQGLMRGLLPIVDNLERALNHVDDPSDGLAQGVEMILKQFADVLSAQGMEPIPALGEVFDPNVHEALTHQPSEQYPADTVMEEFQRGYRIGEYILRPSQVVVSSGPPETAEVGGNDATDTSAR